MRALRLPRRLRGAEAPQPQGGTEGSDPPEHEDAAETPQPHVGMLASAPVPLDWERFADRRPRRLKRGKHFVGEPKILQREAEHAAKGMGKVALVSRDQQGKWGYVWIQFVDAEVNEGEPCPVCDSYELLKLTNDVIRCPSCDSMLEFIPRPLEMPVLPEMGTAVAGSDQSSSVASPREASEFAEIVSTRTLRRDGTVAEAPSTRDALIVETIVRSHRPCLRVLPSIAADVDNQRVFASGQRKWAELGPPGLYALRAHIPPGVLVVHTYRFKIVVQVDDGSGGEPVLLVRRKATVIRPVLPASVPPADHGFLRPALEWTTEGLDPEEADDDLVSAGGGART
jgi:hypothetical protein